MRDLKKLFEAADHSSLNWYTAANEFCSILSDKYSQPVDIVAGVVAALSPGINWERNKFEAAMLFETIRGEKGKFKFTAYGRNVLKAYNIAEGKIRPEAAFSEKTGAKTYNFYYNILKPLDPEYVTIDRHAYRMATGNDYRNLTPKMYRDVASHYKKAAAKIGILPNQLQAVLWTAYREENVNRFREYVLAAA